MNPKWSIEVFYSPICAKAPLITHWKNNNAIVNVNLSPSPYFPLVLQQTKEILVISVCSRFSTHHDYSHDRSVNQGKCWCCFVVAAAPDPAAVVSVIVVVVVYFCCCFLNLAMQTISGIKYIMISFKTLFIYHVLCLKHYYQHSKICHNFSAIYNF